MSGPPETSLRSVPKIVWVAALGMLVQAVATMFVTAYQFSDAGQQAQHGRVTTGFEYVLLAVNLVVAVLLAVAFTTLLSRRPRARTFAVVLEAAGILENAVNAFAGHLYSLTPLFVAVAVIALLTHPTVGGWLTAAPGSR
ncbi:hypothetical protein GCM10009765_68400 [Fodinicola feengrottensis]|uniref:DUF4386 family protein n=1 Tax=Fodinicola feengrottensis TaxID=435914 RepID=A0ABN2IPP7_9ACTN